MTYQELCSFETLYAAYLEARKGKRKKAGTAQYEANALICTARLSAILLAKNYRPSKFELFKVYEPKERDVQAPAFVDKVVLHAVVDNVLYDAICKSFIRDNYASQKGKGTHDGLSRLKHQMVTYYRRNGTADGWVLKGDVRHFFASINHDKLKAKLRKLFARRGLDMEIYDLLCVYIDASEGLPLGYQTSQLLALMFLDEFDHWVKEEKGCDAFGRYMDDFYIIDESKERLQEALKIIRQHLADRGLELNGKTQIFPLRNGLDFLGFHSYINDDGQVIRKVRKASRDRMKRKLRKFGVMYAHGAITREEIAESYQSWRSHALHGDCRQLVAKFDSIYKTTIERSKDEHVQNIRQPAREGEGN